MRKMSRCEGQVKRLGSEPWWPPAHNVITTSACRCHPFPGIWLEDPRGRRETEFNTQFLC